MRSFNRSLSDVSGLLEGEKEELSASLRNLSVALTEVSSFVKDNHEVLGRNISGLTGCPRCWSSSATRSTRS